MRYNIAYEVKRTDLFNGIDAEVSRVAQTSVSEQGVPLYDAIKIYSRDKDTINGYINDSIDDIVNEFGEQAAYQEPTDESNGTYILFYFPDIKEENESLVKDEIDKFIVMSSSANWFMHKQGIPQSAEEYTSRRNASLKRISLLLRTRKTPTR